MKYLFFDIECSNCFDGNGKIIEFGYCITDESFNLIRKDYFVMSPGKGHEFRFDNSIYKRDSDFKFAFDYDYYYSCDEFPSFYNSIKKLIIDKDTMIFGHAISNDINYLDYTCRRYHLEPLHYVCYDTQTMMRYYSSKHKKFTGLKDACTQLCSKEELFNIEPHLSRDDAVMTMMVAREMCKNLNVSLEELIQLCPDSKIIVSDFIKKRDDIKADKKLHPENYNKRRGKIKNEAQKLWGNFYRSAINQLENEESIGKLVTISGKIKESEEKTRIVIEKIVKKGLIPYDDITGSDYFIVYDEQDKIRLLDILKHPYKGEFILLDNF